MSEQKLKIKVKETIEEKRLLNDAERKLYDVYQMEQNPLIIREINDYFDAVGFDYKSYDGNEGTFRKEVIRDATPQEERAYIGKELFRVCQVEPKDDSMVRLCGLHSGLYGGKYEMRHTMSYEFILEHTEDKQILLELGESK